jgi:hypothetical protein
MKYSVLKAVVYVSILAIVGLMVGCKDQMFQINDIVSDPGAFSEPLTVEGIVYAYAKDDTSVVGVMDKKELQCKTKNCSKALLAVKVAGQKLSIGDEIKVSGSITKESWGYVLKAEQTEVLAKHNLGA